MMAHEQILAMFHERIWDSVPHTTAADGLPRNLLHRSRFRARLNVSIKHTRRTAMDQEESKTLEALDLAVRSEAIRPKIEAIVVRVEQKLRERPDDVLAWEPIPLDCYTAPLPETIRSSWVFILRGNT